MSRKPHVAKLPEPDRTRSLQEFLTVLNDHPDLAHFRAVVHPGPDRQLALFAALERAVLVGDPALQPPRPDDDADVILCDVLDVVDRHPRLKNHGSYYGPYRHIANLQAFGVWGRQGAPEKPVALELFATLFSRPTPDATSTLPSSEANLSPASQVSASGGELIASQVASETAMISSHSLPQLISPEAVALIHADERGSSADAGARGIIRHPGHEPGEQCADAPLDPHEIAPRPVRRGRPPVLDDVAKGRLLGLMAFGLSFRQAAAQLGVHHQTLLNMLKRDEEFAQQVSEARFDAISQPLLTVVHASRTNWRAAAWLAKFLEDRRARTIESTPEERELHRARQ